MKQNKYKKAKNLGNTCSKYDRHEACDDPAKTHPSIHLNLNHLHYNLPQVQKIKSE